MTTELDADRVGLTEVLRAFPRPRAGAEVSLLFCAVHDIEMNGVNCLVPVDARLERDLDVRFETETVDDPLVSTSGASSPVMIQDVCPNNPLARSVQRTAAAPTANGGSFADLNEALLADEALLVYAAPATTAGDGRARNGPYTAALLSHPNGATADRASVPLGTGPGAGRDQRRAPTPRVPLAAARALPDAAADHERAGHDERRRSTGLAAGRPSQTAHPKPEWPDHH